MRIQQLVLALLLPGPTMLLGQRTKPADLSGDWALTLERYGEADVQRMTVQSQDDRLRVSFDTKLEGVVRDETITLKRIGDAGPVASMTGTIVEGELSGQFEFGETSGRWKARRIALRPPNASRSHLFEPKVFHRLFSGAIQPVLHIYPGDTVSTSTVDAGGTDGKGVRRNQGGNPLTGPFYVDGALPGDMLVVKFTRIRLNRETAFSSDGVVASALAAGDAANQAAVEHFDSSWLLDRERGIARLAKPTPALKDYTVPLRPMLGCVGVAPFRDAAFRSGYLGTFGGNMDYNRIREGVSLYLPVLQPGALLFIGDGHAAQGDGELTGNALETSMDVEFTVDVAVGKSPGMPRAEDEEFLMAMGIKGSLTEAFQAATSQMMHWLKDRYKLNASEAAAVLGTAAQYDIAEVVDPLVNVVARVPKKALAQIAKPR